MKKNYRKIFLLFFAAVFVFFSCKKTDISTVKNVNAIVDSTGICGFLVKIDTSGTFYNAVNLPELYQSDSVKIVISYHHLDSKFYCVRNLNSPLQEIYIDAIHKQ